MDASGPPPGAIPHVLVDGAPGPLADRVVLARDTVHHLRTVRRLRTGAAVTVTDGAGSWAAGTLAADDSVSFDGPIRRVPRPDPAVTIAFALTKADSAEDLAQKLTEVGVDRIVPFVAARSVVRWKPDKAARQHERLLAVVRGAVEQSHRCWLPEVLPVTTTQGVADLGASRADFSGAWPSLAHPVLAIGPEGGWSDEERAVLSHSVRIGPNTLRSGTAALTGGALLTSIREGFVAERPNS